MHIRGKKKGATSLYSPKTMRAMSLGIQATKSVTLSPRITKIHQWRPSNDSQFVSESVHWWTLVVQVFNVMDLDIGSVVWERKSDFS